LSKRRLKERKMTGINNQIIQCPKCKISMTVDKLGEHVNANPETKKQAIEEEIQLWGEAAYDKNYLIQNVVFCPKCGKVSHFDDWTDSSKTKEKVLASDT
jgi:phage FluMu protein Com